MRVTAETQSQQAILNIQANFAKLAKLQTQISTGNQINAPSDNPVGMVQILQNNTQNAQLSVDLTSIQSASNVLQTSVNSITQTQGILTSVQNQVLSAISATAQSGANSAVAAQINSAINQVLGLANTQLPDGTYLFGGTASKTPPFAVQSSDSSGQATSITYQGTQQDSQVIVGKSLTVNTLIAGDAVFQPNIGGTPVYSGVPGASLGTGAGTDTATGQVSLQVQHTLTTFAGTSGISAGSSSPAGDTILGPSGTNSLVIDDTSGTGTSGTVSLNGGPPVPFTNLDSNLAVTGPSGEVVYLDTSSITAGFNGSVDLTADGTISADGGATTTAIDFSGNQTITNSVTGGTTNVSTSNIRQVGTEQVTYPSQADIFQTLIDLRDTINNAQGLSASDRKTALNLQLAQLQKVNNSLATPLGTQASQAQFLSNLQTRTTALQTNLQQATSTLQSTDMASIIVQLQQQQNLYQAGLQLAAGLNKLSLSNYISL